MLLPIIDINKQPSVKVSVENLLNDAVLALQVKTQIPEGWQDKTLEFTVRFSDDAEVQKLNNDFRGMNKPTNVLSFPCGEDMPYTPEKYDKNKVPVKYIGDIIVSCDTLEREALEQGKSVDDHLSHLLVHSILHLYGYDHIDDAEAEAMENLEIDILAGLAINDPYHK
ncbi:MAG: putative rRNA maturation factor [Alphaproteobacteria bacterium]|jgi:probable rRNA maturation factor